MVHWTQAHTTNNTSSTSQPQQFSMQRCIAGSPDGQQAWCSLSPASMTGLHYPLSTTQALLPSEASSRSHNSESASVCAAQPRMGQEWTSICLTPLHESQAIRTCLGVNTLRALRPSWFGVQTPGRQSGLSGAAHKAMCLDARSQHDTAGRVISAVA